jgi:hypothetical protein
MARKSASGAAESLFIVLVSNLVRRLNTKQQGVWVVGRPAMRRIRGGRRTCGSRPFWWSEVRAKDCAT